MSEVPTTNRIRLKLNPEYTVRPVTKGIIMIHLLPPALQARRIIKRTSSYLPDRTEIKIRDTVAFTPKLFMLQKQLNKRQNPGIDGKVISTAGNWREHSRTGWIIGWRMRFCFSTAIAVLLGDLEPGQEVKLDDLEILNYP